MAKKFFTEIDIEDMFSRGQTTLEITDDVVLTELAFEKAERLGVKLQQAHNLPPSAPVRPYLSQPSTPKAGVSSFGGMKSSTEEGLRKRIRDAVNAKMGKQVDPILLETIITRVLGNIRIK